MTAVLVSGNGTGVGKTMVTAAVAALATGRGERVTVIKPAQTGEPDGGGGDIAEVLRRVPLAHGVELVRYPDPLSPAAAARRSQRVPLTLEQCAAAVSDAAATADLVLVEGAGGILVHYDDNGFTMRDLAAELSLPVLLVTASGLGTLNATALTLEAMGRHSVALAGLVIGSWPREPDLAERCNVADLELLSGQSLSGALPADAAALDVDAFATTARAGLASAWGGDFDPAAFRAAVS